MNTWLVFVTIRTFRGQPVDQAAVSRLQNALITAAGRTGVPGRDPEVTLTADGRAEIRQCLSPVTAFVAVALAQEPLRQWLRPDDIDGIRAVRLEDWASSTSV